MENNRMDAIKILMAFAIMNLAFFPFDIVLAKTESHHVVTKSTKPEDTATTGHTTKDDNKAVKPKTSPNETKAKSKTTNQVKKESASTTKVEKPLTKDSATTVADNLPGYLKDWMKYLNKKCEGDCKLTYADVLKLIEDPNIQGQQAAVLGAIVTQMNNKNNQNIKYSLTELQKMFKENDDIYSWYYGTAIQNINGVRALTGQQDKLFGPTGELSSATRIIQNAVSDCFILSAINGVLHLPGGPQALQNMITRVPGKNDEFIVTLPGDPKSIHVKLTPAKLAMYSNLPAGGEWLAVLSDAEARARKENPEYGIFQGGFQTQTLHLLTGVSYKNTALSPFTASQVATVKSLTKEQWSALENLSSAQLGMLSTLTPKQLEDTLSKDQLKAFDDLTPEQLKQLEGMSSAQWSELGTLIYSNANKIDLKLLKTLQPVTQAKLTSQIEADLNTALNISKPPQIVGIETNEHDLTVLAYNNTTQTLTIKNPWGVTGWYNPVTGGGPDSTKPGTTPPWFDMHHGVFQVQISQLVESNFVTMTLPKSINKEVQISSAQSIIDAAKKLKPEQIAKIQMTLDKAQMNVKKIADYQEEIKETQLSCQQANTSSECQKKVSDLAEKIEKAKVDVQESINAIASVVNDTKE
jgi:hypothetical protein